LEPIAEGKVQVRQIALDGVASQRSPSAKRWLDDLDRTAEKFA